MFESIKMARLLYEEMRVHARFSKPNERWFDVKKQVEYKHPGWKVIGRTEENAIDQLHQIILILTPDPNYVKSEEDKDEH